MSEWISVSESVPDTDQQVWASLRLPWGDQGQAYAIYLGDGEWFIDITESGDLLTRSKCLKAGNTVCDITHWMPLPAPHARASHRYTAREALFPWRFAAMNASPCRTASDYVTWKVTGPLCPVLGESLPLYSFTAARHKPPRTLAPGRGTICA